MALRCACVRGGMALRCACVRGGMALRCVCVSGRMALSIPEGLKYNIIYIKYSQT